MEPKTWIFQDHVCTRVGRYTVHTDTMMFASQAYRGRPGENRPIPGERFKASCDTHDDLAANHNRIVEHLLQLPQ